MKILKFEFLKIFKNKSFVGAAIVLIMSIIGIMFIDFFNSQLVGVKDSAFLGRDSIDRNLDFANKYQGELTDTKINIIISDYLDVYQEKIKSNQHTFDYFPWAILDNFTPITEEQDVYLEMNDAVKLDKKYTINDVTVLPMECVGFKNLGFPIKIGNFMTWTDLIQVTSSAFIPISLLVILFCSILFANDTSKNIVPLLASTRFGRTKMIRSKLLVGTSLTIVTFLLVQLIIFAVFGIFYGYSGWDVSVQANLDWKVFDFPLEWNLLQAYLFGAALHLIGLLFVAGVSMFISSLCSSPFSALATSLGLFFIPQALKHVLPTGVLNKILYLFPVNIYEVDKVLLWMSREDMFFFNTFLINIGLIVIVLLGMKIVLDTITYYRMKNISLA